MATAMYDAIIALHGNDDDGWRHLPIEVTDIPEHRIDRIRDSIARHGISYGGVGKDTPVETLGDLANLTDATLLRIENLGRVGVRNIREQIGLHREKWLRLLAERRQTALVAGPGATAQAASGAKTIRDEFAMIVLREKASEYDIAEVRQLAALCYAAADAMIAERDK